MLRLAFDFIITWRETRTRPNAYGRDWEKIPVESLKLQERNSFCLRHL